VFYFESVFKEENIEKIFCAKLAEKLLIRLQKWIKFHGNAGGNCQVCRNYEAYLGLIRLAAPDLHSNLKVYNFFLSQHNNFIRKLVGKVFEKGKFIVENFIRNEKSSFLVN
jgi:hypothetical protein